MNSEEISLREYVKLQIDWLDRHFAMQVDSINNATGKAHAELNRRLEGMNEFRESLKDQAARFATRQEVDLSMSHISDRLRELERQQSEAVGSGRVVSAIIASAVSILMVALFRFLG